MRKLTSTLLIGIIAIAGLSACSSIDKKEMLARIQAAEDASARAQAQAAEALRKAEEALENTKAQ
ncbi:hypothetical protein VQ643_10100 [Pseudomonas sp. F1_0610]|uniref:hypothetical protein n=1 Tax=Pseudomonas sp. F1_0610 TaxID=3114284 RepID=UPI0039C190E9